jgi:nicotinate-nucleotide adenylyltransferase
LTAEPGHEPKRIGVFGGAFDPPHNAHVALALAALQQLRLDALYVIPTGQAWHKARPLSPAADRLAMCELAFAGLPAVRVDARETQRAGPSYTADTLAELATEYPGADLYLVLGADQLLAFKTWHRWEEVLRLATLAVANRPMHPATTAELEPAHWPAVDLPFRPLDMPLQPTSSTAIRAQVHAPDRQSPDLDLLVPAGVARYISEHHLYQTPT